eukprot:12431214-Karenia_brevis.AAC.1
MVEAVMAGEIGAAYVAEKAEARQKIEAAAKPFKPMPDQIQHWKAQYTEDKERYSMLVLFGPSCTGKSRLARSLFGAHQTLVIDVQHAKHPDLRGYRRQHHRAILLDEVSDPTFIVGNKKLLQAHVDGAILGQSATQLYTYEVFLWKTPIMLTTNNWDYSKFAPADKNWIDTNVVAVYIGSRVWVSGQEAEVSSKSQDRAGSDTTELRRVWSPQKKRPRPFG